MSAAGPVKRARELLENQLEALNEYRNAHARDAGFKAWRQATLTVIQRVWPGDPSRAERFRRVPFSAPSSKMSLVIMRSFFEKGCAEAVKLLRAYIADAATTTLRDGDNDAEEDGFAPGTAEDDFPVLDLPGGPAVPPSDETNEGPGVPMLEPEVAEETTRAGAPPPPSAIPPLPPSAIPSLPPSAIPPLPKSAMPPLPKSAIPPLAAAPAPAREGGGEEARDAQRALDAAIDAMGAQPRPVSRGSKAGRDSREVERSRESREREVAREPVRPAKPLRGGRGRPPARRALKDMLGFGEESEAAAEEAGLDSAPPSEPPISIEPRWTAPQPTTIQPKHIPPRPPSGLAEAPAAPGPRRTEIPSDAVEPVSDGDEVFEFEIEDDPFAQPDVDESEIRAPAAAPPTPERPPAPAAEAGPGVDPMDQFLRSSPVLHAQGRPVVRPTRPREEGASPAAASLVALASELQHLGVPEGHRAAARAELLDLARRVESQALSWESLRGVISFVLEYPLLARRVIPMLIPYLDLAA